MKLSTEARATIRESGVTIAGYTRHHFADGVWRGDACGCSDDRCIGHHHDERDDCGCLGVLLEDYLSQTKGPRWPTRGTADRRVVAGLELERSGAHEWRFPGGAFVARWDEHARAWEVSRSDGRSEFYGETILELGDLEARPVLSDYCYAGTLERAVTLLRKLGHLAD